MVVNRKQREVKIPWEELCKFISIREEEEIQEITLVKPKQVLFRLGRKEKVDNVSEQAVS